MDASEAITMERENCKDVCVDESDTSKNIQLECIENTAGKEKAMDVEPSDVNVSNTNVPDNKDTNMQENEDIKEQENKNTNEHENKEADVLEIKDTNVQENKEADVLEIKDTNLQENKEVNVLEMKDTHVLEMKDTNVQESKDTNEQGNKEAKLEEVKDTNEQRNKDTKLEETKDIKVQENNDTNEQEDKGLKLEEIKDINMQENKDTNAETTEDVDMEKNDEEKIEGNENVKTDENEDVNMETISPTNNEANNSDIKNDAQNNILDAKNYGSELSTDINTKESIDFTADIIIEQFDTSKDVTDEVVMNHLDEIENLLLDSSDFEQSKEDGTENRSTNADRNELPEIIEIKKTTETVTKLPQTKTEIAEQAKPGKSGTEDWYEKKLAEKETIIKERLTKVARVLGISYPCYEKWLECEEKVNGTPLCKLKPSRRCCLDKPHTNRWKFLCTKKRNQNFAMSNSGSFLDKNVEIWKLEASGAWGVNVNNKSQFPPFVLRAVEVFEDFLQAEQLITQKASSINFSDDISMDGESRRDTEDKQEWLWLVVRCNSMDELMLFATGKNISRATMDRLKEVYESGPGKNCNVKSLYCKRTNKYVTGAVTDTTFLVGSEALDEIVGGLKVQLAPKTNFWSNTAGAENVAKAVMDFVTPNPKMTVLEIGCGIGLIGLMMASKCQQVIGVDTPSEVEEAELTCELNNIKNASFIMGSPSEVTSKIVAAIKNRKTHAIINANTNIGRAIEVMTCLRKIQSIKRIVMITTLTKQSVRSILELARPGDRVHGSPFIPVVACVVDTLPVGAHFEAVILMQRRALNKFNQLWYQKAMEENTKSSGNKSVQEKANEQNNGVAGKKLPNKVDVQFKKNFNKLFMKPSANNSPVKKTNIALKKQQQFANKHTGNASPKLRFKLNKRTHSPDTGEATPKKLIKKFNKFEPKPWIDMTKQKKEWNAENTHNPQLRINPIFEKNVRENKEIDLRERLSNNRGNIDIVQTVKEHQVLLEIAKEKLSGSAPAVDVNTAKELQSMLNMVLEQTSKLQSQLPRSVRDRITPAESTNSDQDTPSFKGRFIQEMRSNDIVITARNEPFVEVEEKKPIFKKYQNLMPLEPNTVVPATKAIGIKVDKSFCRAPERFHDSEMHQGQIPVAPWNRGVPAERNRWDEVGNIRKSLSPGRRQGSPFKPSMNLPKRLSPKRPLLSSPRGPCSPPRRNFSPGQRPASPMFLRERSPIRRQMSPLRRPVSPLMRVVSPRCPSPPRQIKIMMNRSMSPLRCQESPIRRQMSPPRRQLSPMSPLRRQMPSPNRMVSPSRQELLMSRRQIMPQERQQTSTMRRPVSPPRYLFERPVSPPKRQQSPPRRQLSPVRFADEWDIPSRRAVEQSTWMRSTERMPDNWDTMKCDDRHRKIPNQEKWEDMEPDRNNTWKNGGNSWNSKQMCSKPAPKQAWLSGSDRWSSVSNVPGTSNEAWQVRGKESSSSNNEPWMDSKKQNRWMEMNVNNDSWRQSEKDDLNDLPEDARDPWGDDGVPDLKERWLKYEGISSSSTSKENQKQGDSWTKHNKDTWHSKGSSYSAKPHNQWQDNSIQNVEEPRWASQKETEKTSSSSSWQNGKNTGSWQYKNLNFQSQRPFTSQFKGL
ncbi:uncharacterized protein LOC108633054 [Ceratina calcarata]|uniref:tRNA (uracil(54)-C(5))-methyltransferase n=1 Tax=Ceratina calcarata TaxID=156304 RepID=A0AAJ7JI89_9HYME|nr:uncharacterized protein LOC108633054 [Ceratina calcarata]XP_017893503.1 uncharacterized protein LOC108633054 [Ceratina calcarata]